MRSILFSILAVKISATEIVNPNPCLHHFNPVYMTEAQESMKMGTIERGVEATFESIPQWTAQIYYMGIMNKLSVLQIASLCSSVLGATYCVIG